MVSCAGGRNRGTCAAQHPACCVCRAGGHGQARRWRARHFTLAPLACTQPSSLLFSRGCVCFLFWRRPSPCPILPTTFYPLLPSLPPPASAGLHCARAEHTRTAHARTLLLTPAALAVTAGGAALAGWRATGGRGTTCALRPAWRIRCRKERTRFPHHRRGVYLNHYRAMPLSQHNIAASDIWDGRFTRALPLRRIWATAAASYKNAWRISRAIVCCTVRAPAFSRVRQTFRVLLSMAGMHYQPRGGGSDKCAYAPALAPVPAGYRGACYRAITAGSTGSAGADNASRIVRLSHSLRCRPRFSSGRFRRGCRALPHCHCPHAHSAPRSSCHAFLCPILRHAAAAFNLLMFCHLDMGSLILDAVTSGMSDHAGLVGVLPMVPRYGFPP